MKIEAGKFYKTRNGRKARIYAVDGHGEYPFHGAYLRDSDWVLHMWKAGGRNLDDHEESIYDLVSEWTEPKPKPKLLAWGEDLNRGYSAMAVIYCLDDIDPNKLSLGNFCRLPWLDEPES